MYGGFALLDHSLLVHSQFFPSVFSSPHVRNPRQSWILDSLPWSPDSRYWIPVFVSGP